MRFKNARNRLRRQEKRQVSYDVNAADCVCDDFICSISLYVAERKEYEEQMETILERRIGNRSCRDHIDFGCVDHAGCYFQRADYGDCDKRISTD